MEDSNPKISQTSLIPQANEHSPCGISLWLPAYSGAWREVAAPFKYETGFPQGLVNVLTCSWTELTERADYHKWHQKSLEYKSMTSRRSQALEKIKNSTPGFKRTDCETTAIRKERYMKSFALPACTPKEKRKPEAESNMPVGSKGWICQLYDSNFEDFHQKLPYMWTLERLEQTKNQIEEQTSKVKEVGFDKPIILWHDGDHKETFSKTWKVQTAMTVTPELTYGKPQIPVVNKAGTAQRVDCGLNDGSSFV